MSTLPRPKAWHMYPGDAAELTRRGWHCETRGCREPAAVVTWRWWRSAAAGRVLVAGHFACPAHGEAFARRHRIQIGPAPDVSGLR